MIRPSPDGEKADTDSVFQHLLALNIKKLVPGIDPGASVMLNISHQITKLIHAPPDGIYLVT
ncbi:MAG TPA: hypothetical protein VEL70_01890 [Candidatus Acidoferrum sp.]|nr:hypothetical protein [Candidatus Acidoferrum sp.]